MFVAGCTGRDEARLEAWEDGAFQPRDVLEYQVSGRRDGARTVATSVLTLANGDRLRVELTIIYNPTPALGSGRWSLEGDPPASGEAVAESIKFLGGQGEGPSLGGRFRLEEDGSPRFRVTLPSRPVEQQGWSVE